MNDEVWREVHAKFSAYARKVRARVEPTGWAPYQAGATHQFAKCFAPIIEYHVAQLLPGCNDLSEDLAQLIFNEIWSGVYQDFTTLRTPTSPWMPAEVFDNPEFRNALFAMIESDIRRLRAPTGKEASDIEAREPRRPNARDKAIDQVVGPTAEAHPKNHEAQNNVKGRGRTVPAPEQTAAAEKLVREQTEVDTSVAAWWLRCTPEHVLRLIRTEKLVASSTTPKRITTASLEAYKWRKRGRSD